MTTGIVPTAQRRRSPTAVRQRVLAAITAHPGITRADLAAAFASVNRHTFHSALNWLLHIDRLIRRDGAWSSRARYYPRDHA